MDRRASTYAQRGLGWTLLRVSSEGQAGGRIPSFAHLNQSQKCRLAVPTFAAGQLRWTGVLPPAPRGLGWTLLRVSSGGQAGRRGPSFAHLINPRSAGWQRRASTYAQRAPVDPPPRKLRRAGRSEDTILRSPESTSEVPVGVHLRCRAATVDRPTYVQRAPVDRRASTCAQRAPVDPPPRKLRRAGRSEDTFLRSPESTSEVPIGEGVTRARLEVSLESLGEFLRLEREV